MSRGRLSNGIPIHLRAASIFHTIVTRVPLRDGTVPNGLNWNDIRDDRSGCRERVGRESREGRSASCCAGERELRLDLFRGMALWLIFIDHLPPNILTWFTIRNYGFSDATEIFIFISGYTAAFVYSRAMLDRGFVVASARIFKRVWQIYVAHVFLFTIYLAEISYIATKFDNPLYAEEMGILDFLKQPDVTIVQALLLNSGPSTWTCCRFTSC